MIPASSRASSDCGEGVDPGLEAEPLLQAEHRRLHLPLAVANDELLLEHVVVGEREAAIEQVVVGRAGEQRLRLEDAVDVVAAGLEPVGARPRP